MIAVVPRVDTLLTLKLIFFHELPLNLFPNVCHILLDVAEEAPRHCSLHFGLYFADHQFPFFALHLVLLEHLHLLQHDFPLLQLLLVILIGVRQNPVLVLVPCDSQVQDAQVDEGDENSTHQNRSFLQIEIAVQPQSNHDQQAQQ